MKMLFLRNLEVFISSMEINLCRLDTFPIMVVNKSSVYIRVSAFRTTFDFTLQLQLYTSLKQTRVVIHDSEKQQTPATEMVNFISKTGVFRGVQQNVFMNSYISYGMAPPHTIGTSDFAIRKD